MHQATVASVSTELEQVEELAEEVKEFNAEAKDITDDARNFSMSIHMPTFNQLEDSKISFLKENSNLAHNTLATNTQYFEKDNLNHQVSKTDIDEKATDKKITYNLIPEDQNMPDTNKFVSNSLDNKLHNWNDNSVACKSQTNIDWPNEKKPLKSSAKDVRSSQVDFELNSPSNYFQGAPISNGHINYKINPTTNQEFAYLNRNKLVNRRLAIKKQNEYSYGLPHIGKSSQENTNGKSQNRSEFALGSENMLNELKNIENPVEMNNFDDADNHYPFGYYKNISSNVVHNIKPKSGKLRRLANPAEVAKSSTIIVLERERSLPTDEGPSPASYHLPRRPPNEKNSPMFTIGKRCFNEKGGGGRTSWEKEWYNSKSPYTIKSDFRRELFWPTPANYRIKSTIGIDSNKAVFYQYPNHSISNLQTRSAKAGISASIPTPNGNNNNYHHTSNIVLSRDDLIEKDMKNCSVIKEFNVNDSMSARDQLELDVNLSSNFVSHSAPKISFKFRERGTQLWSNVEKTPGPGAYDHTKFKTSSRHNRTPQFSVGQSKNALNYSVGPFATL